MLLKQEQVTPCEVDLEIQADQTKVKSAIDKVYKEFAKFTSVPGFRKGKAPRHLLERVVDKERVREYVIDEVLEEAYKDALAESGLKPIAIASVDVKQFDLDAPDEPFIATARVPLAPVVELGEYKGLEVERKFHQVTEEDIDSELKEMLKKNTPLTDVTDRPVQDGDTLLAAMGDMDEESEEGEAEDEEDSRPVRMIEVGGNLPEFDQGIIGMNIDETRIVTINYPDDYEPEELRGTSKSFKITVQGIRERILPEVTDEWVKEQMSKGQPETETEEETIDTVEKLKAKLRSSMEAAGERISDSMVENDLVNKIIESSKVDFPEAMLQEGVHARFHDLKEKLDQRKLKLEDYLAYKKATAEELYEQFKEEEKNSLVTGLVMREIIDKENLAVEDADVEAEIQDMAEQRHVPVETIRAYVERKDVIVDVKNRILQKKLLEYLKSQSNIKTVEA